MLGILYEKQTPRSGVKVIFEGLREDSKRVRESMFKVTEAL